MTARTTTTIWTSDGRFPATTTNALAQTTTTAFSSVTGLPTSQTDPNGLTVLWLYDNFNRKTRENRPDGTASTWTYVSCPATYYCGDPLLRGYVQQSSLDTGGATISYQLLFFDIFERTKYDERSNLNGSLTNIHTIFDALGRTAAVSLPYFDTGGAAGYVTTTYDVLNRVTSVSRPISASNSTPQTTTNYYEGLKTRTGDPQGKQSWTISNANGQVVRAADHSQYHQQFDFDAFGNTVRVRDYYNTVMQTGTYNIRGMRTASTDVDMGSWSYTFNALGELTSQTDAKNQVTSMQYDALGREVLRTEPNAGGTITTALTWGNSAAAKDIGRLTRADRYGTDITAYWETYGFDSLGRPSVTYVNTLGETHAINFTYNSSTGLMDSIMYPASTSGYRHQVVYEYQYGQLRKVRDIGNTVTYWLANNVDARGNITDESLGNGLRTTRGFDAVTGLPTFIRTGPGGGTATQNLNYGFDLVGNLTSRNDANQGLTESLTYDNLYRLTQSTVTGAPTLTMTYNAYGNIISRSDVSSYTYHASKIHAVTAAGGFSYVYDANGNITTRNGSTVTWFANNKPQSIAGNGQTSTFEYGPSGQYWKQTATYSNGPETTLYIGGLLEKVTNSTLTSWRHHIKANGRTVAIYSRASTGATNTIYPLTDHLGSTDAITDSAGTVLVRESFTAFGARRGSNWQGTPTPADMTAIANATRRGYTDHTMLDNLGLVHMNGRVYDPAIGRFLSADPYVQFPLNTQSYNRYSYVLNNPLSFTDPSGYFLGGLGKFLRRAFRTHVGASLFVATAPMRASAMLAAPLYFGVRYAERLMVRYPWVGTVSVAGVCYFSGGFACAAANARLTQLRGGTWEQSAKAGVASLVTYSVGAYFGSTYSLARVVTDGVAGGVAAELNGQSFASGFRTAGIYSLVQYGAYNMRQTMVEQSCFPAGNLNCQGTSAGAFFDGKKIAGGRLPWGFDNWDGVQASILGGNQGQGGRIFGLRYSPGGFFDNLLESYSGSHDWMSSFRYGYQGALIPYTSFGKALYEVYSFAALVPATPFAITTALPLPVVAPIVLGRN
ncbi:MAG: RHS repeat-associated core domain-containing protein [Hyphomicrobiaceae bacterium]